MAIESQNKAGIGTEEIGHSVRVLLADVFTLYLKTKNFHWHMSGPHFRDYHLMLDEQGEQLFEMTDAVAERGRKLGLTTIRSIGDITRFRRIQDNESSNVSPDSMLAVLCDDNRSLRSFVQETHALCDSQGDPATASLLENWIDETERRAWFLAQSTC